jgi:predicted dehydrogenase
MRQVLQDIRSGEIAVHEVPEPGPRPGYVLVAVAHSLVSAGTERALADLGSKSLVQKARARPDLVRKTLESVRAEGVSATAAKVRGRLEEYTAFGYSCAGRVLDAGGVEGIAAGDYVACVGQGYASHADVVSVPANLVVPVPPGVSTADAAFAAPAAIALHAIRIAEVGPGSVVVVIGLGLIGRLVVRLLEATGCRVVGVDPSKARRDAVALAAEGESVMPLVAAASRGRGADAVLVCAATSSSEPVALAAEVARDRGRVVVVGDVGLELDRRPLYEKELSLVVARSYGPGRYDRAYEEGGEDYPVGYVRWTEGRNVEAVLDLLADGRLRVEDLVTHRVPIDEGARAYEALANDTGAVGILLEYGEPPPRVRTIRTKAAPRTAAVRVGLVGAGAFARGTLLPILDSFDDVAIGAVCTRSGASAKSVADRRAVPVVSTDWRELVSSSELDALVIATPHAQHAEITAAALAAGKAVFVEKPLAIDRVGLGAVREAVGADSILLVGHNRRFAPLAQRLAEFAAPPLIVQVRVAAGGLAPGHWLADPEQGGRVLGEISHFVDLAAFLARSAPSAVFAQAVGDGLLAQLRFPGGSAAAIAYGTGENGKLAKERIEVLAANGAAVLDDFARLELHGATSSTERSRRDKGHRAQLRAFVDAVRGEAPLPVDVVEQLAVAEAALALLESARSAVVVAVES